jgi:DNA-directed RNA polymerase subunit E'/Rpb7
MGDLVCEMKSWNIFCISIEEIIMIDGHSILGEQEESYLEANFEYLIFSVSFKTMVK